MLPKFWPEVSSVVAAEVKLIATEHGRPDNTKKGNQ